MTLIGNSAGTITVAALSLIWYLVLPEEDEMKALEVQWPSQNSYMKRNMLFYNISCIAFFFSFLVESQAGLFAGVNCIISVWGTYIAIWNLTCYEMCFDYIWLQDPEFAKS